MKLMRARRGASYFDRCYEGWYTKPRKKVCPSCRITFSANKNCPICHNELIGVSYRAKVPRKNANNRKWRLFWSKHNQWCDKNPMYRKKVFL